MIVAAIGASETTESPFPEHFARLNHARSNVAPYALSFAEELDLYVACASTTATSCSLNEELRRHSEED